MNIGDTVRCPKCKRQVTVVDTDTEDNIIGGGHGRTDVQAVTWWAFSCGHGDQSKPGPRRVVTD